MIELTQPIDGLTLFTPLVAVIELASPWMAMWIAAAGIPIALHLLHRRRQQVMRWAATDLLLQVIQQHARRMQLEQWLLLLLRTCALILLGLALARPWWNSGSTGAVQSNAPSTRLQIIVLDTSYSMQTRDDHETRWEIAKRRAAEIISQTQLGDAVCLVTLAAPSQAINWEPSFERERMEIELQKLNCSAGGADLRSCLDVVERIVKLANQSDHYPKNTVLTFLTDLGEDTWSAATEAATKRRLERLEKEVTSFQIEGIGSPKTENVAVVDLRTEQDFAIAGRSVRASATIHNFGRSTLTRFPIQFQKDGKTIRTEFVDCPAHAEQNIVVELAASNEAYFVLSVEIPTDSLPIDNHRHWVIPVRQQLRVACFEDQPGSAKMPALALWPNDRSGSSNSTFRVNTFPIFELTSDRLKETDCVLLCNLRELPARQTTLLQAYLEGGGAVLCLLERRANATAWNANTKWKELAGFELNRAADEGDYELDPLRYASPFAKPFEDFPDAGLLTTPIFRYWKIQPQDKAQLDVDLAFTNGDAWIVHRQAGRGSVTTMLSAPVWSEAFDSETWNAVGTWPSFVPLIQQIVQTTAGASDRKLNLVIGQAMTGNPVSSDQTLDVQIKLSDETQQKFSAAKSDTSEEHPWTFTPNALAGIYFAEESSTSHPATTTPLAVNIDTIQSSLVAVSPTSLPKGSNNELIASANESSRLAARQHDRFARYLLLALIVVLATESLLAWNMGRRFA